MKSKSFLYKNAVAVLAIGSLVSCATVQYQRPEAELHEKFRTGNQNTFVQDSAETSIAEMPYSEFFKDPELIALIDKGIEKNNDLQVALKQLDIASLSVAQSKWYNIPTVNLNIASAAISRYSDNSINGQMFSQMLGKKYAEDYGTNVTISWEADIWGKIKARKETVLADYLKTQEAVKTVQTQLVSQIAQGYYNLLMLDTQLDITNQNIELAKETLHTIKRQQELGISTSLSVQQQENQLDQMLATIPEIKKAISIQENTLSILTSELPGKISRNKTLTTTATPDYQSIGVPAEMLSLRPDVRSSELSVRQAFSGVKIAKKSMYPSFSITAQGGLNAYEFKNWFDIPGSLFGLATGSLTQPLLNGKQLKTQYEQSKIGMEQAEINFKQTVLNAVGEVSNILATIESADEQEKITEGLVERTGQSVVTSQKMFKNDMAINLDVIMAQNNKLQAELSLASIRYQKLNAVVNLYRALGGGWK